MGSFEPRRVLYGHTEFVATLAYSPDGSVIVSGSGDRTVRLWDASSGECRYTLQGHTDCTTNVAYSPNGATIATGNNDATARLWSAASGECRRVLKGHADRVLAVAFSPDGWTIATGGKDKTVRLWDPSSGTCQRVLEGHTRLVGTIAFSLDGVTIATGSDDGTVRLWDAASGECQNVLKGHKDEVWRVVYSPDGTTIATASRDKTVRLWATAVLQPDDASSRPRVDIPQVDGAHTVHPDDCPSLPDFDDEPGAVRTDLEKFYAVFNPDLGGSGAEKILRNYAGRYDMLADVLKFKYLDQLPEHGDLLPSSPGFAALVGGLVFEGDTMSDQHVAQQLRSFFEVHAPARIDDVPRLIRLYAGRYQSLFDSINAAAFDLPTTCSGSRHNRPPFCLPAPQWPDLHIDESRKTLVGRGAFGDVYRVLSHELNVEVAMKCVTVEAKRDGEKLEAEAATMRELADCPHIVRVLGFQRLPQHALIYMELMPGGSLEDVVRNQGPQWEERCRGWMIDALLGLKRIHVVDLVHRDIKPANMLLDGDGHVKLSDFGLAKDIEETAHSAGDAKGTAPYLAPELLVIPKKEGGLEYTSACDVWSLGCTWVRLLTGKDPWDGVIGDEFLRSPPAARLATLMGARFMNPQLQPMIPPWLSKEAQYLLGRVLCHDPAERIVVEGLLHSEYFRRAGPPTDCKPRDAFVDRVRSTHTDAAATAAMSESESTYSYDESGSEFEEDTG